MLHKKPLSLLLLSVAVLILIIFWGTMKKHPNSLTNNESKVGVKSSAPKGQLVQGFPQNLKLTTDSSVVDSFTIPYQNFKQYSAVFQSNDSIATVYKQYLDYVSANGYTILSKGQDKNFAHIYGTKSDSDLNIAINVVNGKTQINIGYLNKTVTK